MGVAPLVMRPADVDEFEQVMALLAESIRWLRQRGLDQWSTWRSWRAKMRPSLENGGVWLLINGAELIGTLTVEYDGDSDFWTPDERAQLSGYVSKLAVRREHAGRELGALMLEWAGDHVYRQGRDWLRLDAWKTNEQLHAYYRERGWTYLRTSPNPRRRSGALFQVPARPLSPNSARLIREVPPMSTVETSYAVPPEPGPLDPQGNWQPGHTHNGGLVVDYRWVGPSRATFVEFLRYRVRQMDGDWVLEASQGGHGWDRHGRVLASDWTLEPGTAYIITHQPGTPCQMAVVGVPAGSVR